MTTTPTPPGPNRLNPDTDHDCASCGATGIETEPVRRVYVDTAAPDAPDAATVTDEVERWCESCQANYPHRVEPQPG